MLRAFVIILTSVLLLALLAVGTAWYFLRDEAFLKRQIEDAVERETDRSLSIDGPLSVDIGKSIRISASAVTLTDATWTGRDQMVSVGEIVMRVDGQSLFDDRLDIQELTVSDCEVSLETSATGERNWDIAPKQDNHDFEAEIAKHIPGGVSRQVPVVLHQLDINRCHFAHNAPERSEPLKLEVEALSLHSDPQGHYSGDARGSVNATRFQFSGRFGPPKALWQGGEFVEEIDFQLGEIALRSSGRFADGRTGEDAQLTLRFTGPEILQVAEYLNVPPFSSGPFDATVTIDTRNASTLLGIDGDLGTLKITADGEMDRLRDPQRGKVNLDAQGPDLHALGEALGIKGLVPEQFELKGGITFDTGKVQLTPLELNTPRDRIKVNGTLESLAKLEGSRFEIEAASEDVDRWAGTWGGLATTLGAVELSGKLVWRERHVHLDEVNIVSGADRGRVNGELHFAPRLAGTRMDIDLQLASMASTGNRIGLHELPELPAAIQGALAFDKERLSTSGLSLEAGSYRAQVSGDMSWAEPLSDFTLTWQTSGDDLSAFYAIPGFGEWPQDFVSSGSWTRQDQRDRFEGFKLRLGSLSLDADGTLAGREAGQPVDLRIRAAIPDASQLESLLRRSFRPEPLQVSAGMSGSWQDLQFSELEANLGKMQVDGNLRLQRSEATDGNGKNRLSGNLVSSFLDVSTWFEKGLADKPDGTKPAVESKGQQRVFDDRPVMGFSKSPIDLDLKLDIAEADLGTSTLHDLRLDLLWTDDELRFDQVSLRGTSGATLSGFFAIDGREAVPQLELKFRGENLMLGLGALEEQDPATYPPMELVLDLQGAGKTMHDLAKSLNGRVRMFQGEGLFGSARMSVLFNDFISELFVLLNPFAKQSKYSRLDCSVFAADVDGGLMTITPVIVQTPELTILSQGTIDLATERVDMEFRTKARKGVGISAGTLVNPFIKVGGQLGNPAVELDPKGAVISGGAAVATVGLSLVFKSFTDRFFSSRDPCGDARKKLDELDGGRSSGR